MNLQSKLTESSSDAGTLALSDDRYDHHKYTLFKETQNHKYLWPAVIKEIQRHRAYAAHVLDAGCGTGAFARVLHKEYGHRVCGCELSDSGIALAQRNVPECRFEKMSVYDSFVERFKTRFDVVVSVEVLEHLYDPPAFLERVHEALTPNGLLVLTTPYHGYLKNLAIAVSGKCDAHYNPLNKGGHIKFWSPRTITQLLESAGFFVAGISGVGRLPWLWKSMVIVARAK